MKENNYTKPWCLMLFLIIISSAKAQQLNDECLGAITLDNVTNWCSDPGAFNNLDASSSPEQKPFCFPQQANSNDVWFAFVAQANAMNITINGNTTASPGGTLEDPEVAIYSGNCGIGLTELECISDAFNNNAVETFAGSLTVGNTYYIRVDARNENIGTFQLCLNNFNEVPSPSSDCNSGVILCDKSPFTVQNVFGEGTIPSEIVNSSNCTTQITEANSSWYKWTCEDPGTLTFSLTPNNPFDDLDFVVYELPNGVMDCNNKIALRSMGSGENVGSPLSEWVACTGNTGLNTSNSDTEECPGCQPGDNNFLQAINMQTGKSYALVINNFSNSGQGFSLSFGGTGTFQGPNVNFTFTPENNVECDEMVTYVDSSFFEGGTIVEWNWNFGSGAMPQAASGPGPHDVVYASIGVKSVALTIVSDEGCVVTKIVDNTILSCCEIGEIVNLDIDDVIHPLCNGEETGVILVDGNGGTPAYEYSLNGGLFQATPSFQMLGDGIYNIILRDTRGCLDSTIVAITEPPPFFVDAGRDTTIELGYETDLLALVSPPSIFVNYVWDSLGVMTCFECQDPTVMPFNTTTFGVTAINSNGCMATDSVTVFLVKNRPVFIPNVFSPNFDGTNDFFTAYAGRGATQIELIRIFNRWGALIYEETGIPLNDEQLGWDGTFKGEILSPDVFTYYIVIGFIDSASVPFKGDVTIIK